MTNENGSVSYTKEYPKIGKATLQKLHDLHAHYGSNKKAAQALGMAESNISRILRSDHETPVRSATIDKIKAAHKALKAPEKGEKEPKARATSPSRPGVQPPLFMLLQEMNRKLDQIAQAVGVTL